MFGQVELQRFDARGLNEVEIRAGIDAMGLSKFLNEIHKNGEWGGKNRVLVPLARSLYYANGHSLTSGGFLNAPNPGYIYSSSINPGMGYLALSSDATEPDVTESYSSNNYNHTPANTITPTKRFDTDGVVDVELFKDPGGKESAIIRQKVMWFPGEATSTSIRSICVYGLSVNANPPATTLSQTRMARWRIKTSGGVPVTLAKAAQEVLLLQYSFIMYSN